MKVLIIEDDVQLNIAINEFFKIKAFDTVSVKDGLQAIDHIDNEDFDLYLIDINIPNISGIDLLKHIRKKDLDTPVIIITASLEIQNFSMAFENGCSEYIKKPFHLKELDIRINNLLTLSKPEIINIRDEFHYDFNTEAFYYQDKPIHLRYKEKRFCAIMIKNINSIVPNELIHDYVWEGEIKETYPLRQLLGELRKKLPFDIIQTKIREGYIIETQK
ncbi:response regulator transcription factor [Sulfurovum sp.]|uniref:response regulator transcription factor n=1 Tax=Sulfurovum sp. TaxID=1969726 RepID=UPI0035692EC2